MYRKKNKIIMAKNDPSNYILGYDIYDSLLLSQINDTTLEKESYEITVHEYRPDLIAQDIYGSTSYLGLFLLQVKKPLTDLKRGTILSVLPKTVLDTIIKNM
jgi:hypothetical protein